MRELKLNEEEFKSLKEYVDHTKDVYKDAYHDNKVSFGNYNNMDKVLDKIDRLKKVRVRYDKTETERYWIEELKGICREIKS